MPKKHKEDKVSISDALSSLKILGIDADSDISKSNISENDISKSDISKIDISDFDTLSPTLSPKEQIVGRVLTALSHQSEGRSVRIGLQHLIQRTGLSKNTVRFALKALEENGLIETLDKANHKERGSLYKINMVNVSKSDISKNDISD